MTAPRPAADRVKPARRPQARKYVNQAAVEILAVCYPGQVPAAVIERALRQLAKQDGLPAPNLQPRRTA